MSEIKWDERHILKIGNEIVYEIADETESIEKQRKKIEPWLTAVFQSEHLSLLTGTGLSIAIAKLAIMILKVCSALIFSDSIFGENIKKKC
jgi:hypothetical protein